MSNPGTRVVRIAALVATLLAPCAVRAVDLQSYDLVERGHYLATAADCAACHTKPGGKPFAGGVALETPFGTLIGPNITPDPDAGIGAWSDDEFVAALQEGRGRDGVRLYPAMPYPAYTKMTREDALAIRAYLRTIEPAPDKIDANQLPFPFNIRSDMAVWNALNFRPGRFAADPSQSAEWNRGRYLVDALGHCGTCHTPKTALGADRDSAYLQGATLQGWFAPNITADERKGIGRWSSDELVNYLKTGANRDAIASGGMGEEVVHSSSHMTDEDLKAIATYLLSLKPASPDSAQPLSASDARMVAGQAIYKDNCAGCHTDDGTGIPRLFPRIAGSHAVQSDDPTTLIRTVLLGSQGAATAAAPTGPTMPSFAWRLDDAQIASVLTYIRNTWGNAASAVSANQVVTVKGHGRRAMMIDLATAPYAAFFLRLCLGIMFIAHALLNGVFTLRETTAFFSSIGLPGWFVHVIIAVELVGGACLILGIVPRYVALLLIPEILGTIVKVHGRNGWRFTDKGGGWEFPAFWAAALFVLFLLGDGVFTLVPSPPLSIF
jgi:mono/diheme cytochrome c family protein/uncharacterized membrane protein YphA (DoxX/SURF4 family)